MKRSKCSFFKEELHYLGHLITTDGIKPQLEKVEAILDLEPPTTQKGVREFLGMVGYYRKFINRFADAARLITRLTITRRDVKFEWSKDCQIGFEYLKHSFSLFCMVGYYRKFINRFADAARLITRLTITRRDVKFEWSKDCQIGFEYLKHSLTKDPILKYSDLSKRYVLFTDTSDQVAGAVLTQEYPDNNGIFVEMPITYLSTQFSDSQFKLSTIVKEGYAIY